MDTRRTARLAEAIREELDAILNYELTDPRIGSVSVAEVILTRDGRRAMVRLSIESDPESRRQSVAAITGARTHIRRLLTERLGMFHAPDIEFESALQVTAGRKVDSLLRRVRRGRPRD